MSIFTFFRAWFGALLFVRFDSGSSSSTSAQENYSDSKNFGNQASNGSTVIVTDGGAVAAAVDLAKSSNQTLYSGLHDAVGLADKSIDSNLAGLKINAAAVTQALGSVVDLSRQAIGMAKDVNDSARNGVSEAYKTAQDVSSGQRMLIGSGLMVVALVAVVSLRKKNS